MKKVLFILHLPPPVHGSSVVGQFIKQSALINGAFEARYIDLGTSRSVDEIGKNPFGKIGRYLSIVWRTLTLLISFRPALCYLAITAKGPAFFKDALLALLVKLFRVRLVYHFHNKGVSTCQHSSVYHFFYQWVFGGADAILLSPHLYYDVREYFTEDRVHYCPNGIPEVGRVRTEDGGQGAEIRDQRPEIRRQTTEDGDRRSEVGDQRSEDGPVEILFLSNLIEAKGVLVLLGACRLLKDRKIPFHCTFVGGDGDLTVEECRQKTGELELENQIKFVGKKYGEEKAMAFSYADIFAFPTYYANECFPLVLLESLQYGLPAVSAPEGGIADIVEDGVTGFLVPKRDPEALAEKLIVLINDSQLRIKLGEAGYNRYKEKFTLEIFEQRMASILTQIATGC